MTGVAAGWGFAEATLFFVIPDVYLTWVAVRHGHRLAWRPAWWATLGAVAGGLLMWRLGAVAPEAGFAVLDRVPAIDGPLIEAASTAVEADGSRALVAGAFGGVPYKIFAAAAGWLGQGAVGLAAWTVVGRMARFAVAIGVVGVARWLVADRWPPRVWLWLWATFWALTYVTYWFA